MSAKKTPDPGGTTRGLEPARSLPETELQRIRELLVECTPGLILRREAPGRVEPLGQACLEFTGWEAAAFADGREFAALIWPEDRARLEAALDAARASGEGYSVEYRISDRGGKCRWLHETGRPDPRAGRQPELLGLAIDMTRVHSLEEQLLQTQKLEAIGKLTGGIAHDFNNLLTAILGYSDMLAATLPTNSTEHEQALQVVHAAQRAADLTRRLLTFARKDVIEPRPLDLSDLVLSVDVLLRRLIGADVELVSLPAHGLGQVMADPGQIEQVLVSLAVNARQAMPAGGKLTIETREAGEVIGGGPRFVQLVVSDTGVGMDAQTRERIFEPFFTTRSEGTGLGLASCRAIVEQAGGRISVESTLGRGTTFTIWLPRTQTARPSASVRSPTQRVTGGNESILIVEDDPLVRSVAAESLSQLGYEVRAARSGVEALEVIAGDSERPLHLLVTDVVLPRMSGREVARRVLTRSPSTRVLYVSGYAYSSRPGGGLVGDPAAFLAKPFTPRGLAQAVRRALDAP